MEKILPDDLTEPMRKIAAQVDRSFYYHRTLITWSVSCPIEFGDI